MRTSLCPFQVPSAFVLFFCEVAPTKGETTPLILSYTVATFLYEKYPSVRPAVRSSVCKCLESSGSSPDRGQARAAGCGCVRLMPVTTDPLAALGKSWMEVLSVESEDLEEEVVEGIA